MKKIYSFIYVIIYSLITFNIIFAQQFSSKYYTEEEGLPDAFVNDIAQDVLGRIWFATRSGIGIYDGNKWVYYNNANGLKNQNILKLQFDNFQKPWVLSAGANIKIAYFDNNIWNDIPVPNSKIDGNIILNDFNVQFIDNQFIIFVGTESSGLFVYRHGYWSNYTKDFGLPSMCINSIEYFDNLFYIGTTEGGVCFDHNMTITQIPFLKEAGKSILLFKKDTSDSQENLWVMGNKSIGYIKNKNFVKVSRNEASTESIQYYNARLIPNFFHSLIYSCSQSLIVFDKDAKKITKLNVENGLQQIGATDLFVDREKNLWITSMRGVTKIASMRFANYNQEVGLYKDEVTAIDEIRNGELIFGHNNGFSFYTEGKISHLKIENPAIKNIGYNRILDIAVDGQGNAYFASAEAGFGKIDNNKNITWLNKEKLKNEAVSIEVSPTGEIYCLTYSNLYLYKNGNLKNIYSFGSAKVNARKIFFNKNKIYICTADKGLASSEDFKNWNYYESFEKKGINNVYSLFDDDRYGKIVGTEDGLYLAEDNSLKKFNIENFRIDRPVYFIAKDTLSNLWFGTNNGVYVWDGKNDRYFSNKTGLIGHETNRDAGFMCSMGCVWIGTDKGVSRYLSKYDKISEIAEPIVFLDSIIVGDKSYYANKSLQLPYSNNDVIFDVNVVSLISEDQNELHYKLLGYDDKWQVQLDSRSNHIRYTNLPPGEYFLTLIASNALHQASETFTSQKVVIEKPFYYSFWFYLVVAIIVVVVSYVSFKDLERIHYSKKLEKEVKLRTDELKESENKYKSLLTNVQDGFYVIQNGDIKLANEAFARMLGYELDELIDKNYEGLIAPEDIQTVSERYKARQDGEDIVSEYEFKMLNKNGSRVYVNMNVNIGIYEGAKATIGTIKDITHRKKSEELLKKLSTAVNQSPNIVVITDQYGIVEYVNPQFTEVSGYAFDEIKNRNINIVKSGLIDNSIYERMWDTIKKGELWKGELTNRKKNGGVYYVRATISPIIDGKEKRTTHYLSTQEDITFEKYANEEMHKGEKLLSSVLNNVPVMIFAFDNNGNVNLVKGKILEILGFNQEMVVGRSAFKLFSRTSEVTNDIKRAIKGESFKSVVRIKKYTFEVSYTPMFNSANIHKGTLGVAYNITDRKKYEIDLIKAKEEAEKSDRLKSEFLAQMSHEIRTPINSILSFTTLLKDELKNSLPEDLSDGFLFIENGAKRLIRTIDLILNMSQIQTGTYQPFYCEVDLDKDILVNIIKEFQGIALSKKIDLIYKVSSEGNILNGDSYTLGQIFANLVDNAIKYTPKGKVEVELGRTNGQIIVKVNDTGIGISNEFIPILFTPFTQEESGYTRKFEGNGLGLALVKKYVEMNNASINVESEKGKGSSFVVSFNNKLRFKA